MKAVIYARYSAGPRQTDQSIEGQIRACTEFCKQKDLELVGEYCDRHISGRTDERPEFQRLIADAKKKVFEAVVVYKTDRFARNKYDSAIYKRELKKNGIQIYYVAEAIPDGPEGIILESLMEGLAEYYSAELAQKFKRGMKESAYKGQSTGGGRLIGYTVDGDKRFQVDSEGAQAVQMIFDLYIKGIPNSDICEKLNARGFRTLRGEPFNKNSINRIIKNRKYIGEYRYQDIVIPDGMPRIISDDTFALAQREMDKRRRTKTPKSPKAEYLLAGKLYCGHCKALMVGVSGTGKTGRKWYYYYCPNNRGSKKTCDKKQTPKEALELAVVQQTKEHILKKSVLGKIAHKVFLYQAKQNDRSVEIKIYEKKLSDNRKAIANYLKMIETGVATTSIPERIRQLEDEQTVIQGEIAFLKERRFELTEDQILFMLMQYLKRKPDESEQEYNKRIINCFISEVYLYDDHLLIFYNVTGDDGKLQASDLESIEAEVVRPENHQLQQRVLTRRLAEKQGVG